MKIVQVDDGRNFAVAPLAKAAPTGSGNLLFRNPNGVDLVELDFEGCISAEDAGWLEEWSYGSCRDSGIFARAEFAKAIFGWDMSAELDGLRSHFEGLERLNGLDVGCGYGRLLMPLTDLGYRIDGIDQSLPLIEDLSANLGTENRSRAFCVQMENFCSPGAYGYAYAAMNTVRYLQTKYSFLRHFACMEKNLQPGGIYLFCISIVPKPDQPYKINWRFEYENRAYEISWRFYSYCHVTEQITEEIVIWDTGNERVFHTEHQVQGFYPLSFLRSSLWENDKNWILEGTYDTRFNPLEITAESRGTFWFKLRRK
jgi:SAM-dependent methyltransferase